MRLSFQDAVKRGLIPANEAPKSARRKSDIEGDEQILLIKRFRSAYSAVGELLIHIPNGGFRKNAFEGWRLKEQGVRAGVSDLLLPVARGGFFGLWIEFKASPPNNSPVSEGQDEWIALMLAQGYHAEVCLGQDAAFAALEAYMKRPPTKVITT